ncbi:MAG: Jag protein [Parcubacteria group bacterium GW2011_GWC1_38_17]|nr:MAG: Jag protein [Parcubacteria group bacterium GW2011_GWC1_38_17]
MNNELFLKILKEFLAKMGYGEDLIISQKESADEKIFEIEVPEAKYLIGEKGSNLTSLEFLVKMICQKQNIDTRKIFIDINNYRKERIKLLKETARLAAQKAVLTKEVVVLPPMSAFDRKIIHTELTINPNIKTESEGFAEERRVIVRPNF